MSTDKRSLLSSYKDCPVSLSYSDYSKINRGFMKFIMQQVLSGKQVELPARMGIIMVAGRKIIPRTDSDGNIVNLAPDWVKTKQLWDNNPKAKQDKTLVYHFNEHTGGIRYKIVWNKGMSGALNKILYIFKPSRENKRNVWKAVVSGKEYYVKPKYHSHEQSNVINKQES